MIPYAFVPTRESNDGSVVEVAALEERDRCETDYHPDGIAVRATE